MHRLACIGADRVFMKTRLLFMLLAMCLPMAVAADHGRSKGPEIDIYEVVRIAKAHEVKARSRYGDGDTQMEWRIAYARRYHTPEFVYCHPVADLYCRSIVSMEEEGVREKLKGRVYWLVYLTPVELTTGDGLTFYIDANTSELIHTAKMY